MKFLLLPALTALTLALLPPAAKDDVVFQAMHDEMERSVERLHMDQYKKPYFVAYTVRQTEQFDVLASFGSIDNSKRDLSRTLKVDVREGDYTLDSSHSGSGPLAMLGLGGGGGGGGTALVVNDNYDAIRHEIWLRTDAAYKKAIEDLASKKAALLETNIKDVPDSMSREKPVVSIEAPARLEVDERKITDMVRRLSAIFKEYPQVQKSVVNFEDKATTRWFVNNEGFCNRTPRRRCYLIAAASAQATNGAIVSDTEFVACESADQLPSEEVLAKKLRNLAERLTNLAQAKEIEQYRGPILFEGEAAAQFIEETLQNNLGYSPEPLSKLGGFAAKFKNPLADRLGSRILPKFISVVDDPLKEKDGDKKVLTSYKIDDDGVEAQKITLIDKGVLKTFAMGRVPSRDIKQSNGHGRGGSGAANNLYVLSEDPLSPDKLKTQLIALGKENNLKEVVIVKRLSNAFAATIEPQAMISSLMGGFMSGGELHLPAPAEIYTLNIETGKEEPARGAQFGSASLRMLREIEATGNDTRSYLLYGGPNSLRSLDGSAMSTISTPSILVNELEISKPSKQTSLPPILKNPYFEKGDQ